MEEVKEKNCMESKFKTALKSYLISKIVFNGRMRIGLQLLKVEWELDCHPNRFFEKLVREKKLAYTWLMANVWYIL